MSAIRTVTSDTAQGSQPPLKTLHNMSTTDVQLELGQLQKNIPGNQQCRKIQKQGKKQSTAKQTLLGKKNHHFIITTLCAGENVWLLVLHRRIT